jgi:anti-sigma factor RsiW
VKVTCREFADFIADYLSGELDPDVRARFDEHLQVCSNCVNYLSNYQAAIKLGKRALADEDAPLPADVPDELVQAILASRRR